MLTFSKENRLSIKWVIGLSRRVKKPKKIINFTDVRNRKIKTKKSTRRKQTIIV